MGDAISGDNTLQAVNPTTGDVSSPIPVGIYPASLVFDGKLLWVANLDDNTVQAIDPVTKKVNAPIQVGKAPSNLAFDGARLWVVNSGDDTVQYILVYKKET